MIASNPGRSRALGLRGAKRRWGFLGAVVFAATGATGAPSAADEASSTGAAFSRGWEFAEQGGADLFDHVCAACHQPDARGAAGAAAYPPLAGDKKLASANFMLDVLFSGLRGMPPLGQMMSDQQVADVVNYVRTHFGNSYAANISAAEVSTTRRRIVTTP
jgi:mono/diheme cytochrome c family protein